MIVTFLPSSNGFGHLNRCVLLALFFIDKGWDCNIWCPKDNFHKIIETIKEIKNKERINCLDLKMPSVNDFVKRSSLAKSFLIEASEKLARHDLIISDNHIENLLISKNVILSANFFWHQNYLFNKYKDDYSIYCSEIIKRHKPYVISSEIFQDRLIMPNLKNVMIGLIANKNSLMFNNNYKNIKDSILVSVGITDSAIYKATHIIQKLIDNKIHLTKRVYIEPRLMKYRLWPKQIEEANYTEEMYKSLIYAFIRPGLGTLVNCLSNLVCPICFNEDKNLEMINNKNAIKKNKLGLNYDDYENNFFNSTKLENEVKHILPNIQNLNFDGANQFYDAVVKIRR